MTIRRKIKAFAHNGVMDFIPFHLSYWKWIRLAILVCLDIVVLSLGYWISYVLRLDSINFGRHSDVFIESLPLVLLTVIGSFFWLGVYRQVWRYANYNSALLIGRSLLLGVLVFQAIAYLTFRDQVIPRSVPVIFFFVSLILVTGTKFFWRFWITFVGTHDKSRIKTRCFVYGAGNAGELFARHVVANPGFPFEIVGFIDDDKNKNNRTIHGIKILGAGNRLRELAEKNQVETIIIALHAAPGKIVRNIVKNCHGAGIHPLIMPEISTLLGKDVIQPRDINIADLLKRSPQSIDHDLVRQTFRGKTVMITGAGGSIGSEIVRQVSRSQAKRLILVDSSEHNLYQIDLELKDNDTFDGTTEILCCLGSVVDSRFITSVMENYRPEIILHAAAYKHVPMVESNPLAGIINNVLGMKILCDLALKFDVKSFLLISSDKAVRPTNIMGGTKRCCELLLLASNVIAAGRCKFTAVRFGNVLGSSGSVIPRFLTQIKAGGPVTVTHPDINRYFMLTEEAVGLVLQSVAQARGGEIFVLDMGEPVSIVEMAQQLIRLAGKEPGKDIEIEFTGLRPGEKLFEELILDDTEKTTVHENVFISVQEFVDPVAIASEICTMIDFALAGEVEKAVRKLKQLSFPVSEKKINKVDVSATQSLH